MLTDIAYSSRAGNRAASRTARVWFPSSGRPYSRLKRGGVTSLETFRPSAPRARRLLQRQPEDRVRVVDPSFTQTFGDLPVAVTLNIVRGELRQRLSAASTRWPRQSGA